MHHWRILSGLDEQDSWQESRARMKSGQELDSAHRRTSQLLPRKWGSPVAQMVKHLPAMHETQVRSLGQEDPLKLTRNAMKSLQICLWYANILYLILVNYLLAKHLALKRREPTTIPGPSGCFFSWLEENSQWSCHSFNVSFDFSPFFSLWLPQADNFSLRWH